jgi:hypothetical protein
VQTIYIYIYIHLWGYCNYFIALYIDVVLADINLTSCLDGCGVNFNRLASDSDKQLAQAPVSNNPSTAWPMIYE